MFNFVDTADLKIAEMVNQLLNSGFHLIITQTI